MNYAVLPGDTLQETIDALGMSQAVLAERTGTTEKTIGIAGVDYRGMAYGNAHSFEEAKRRVDVLIEIPSPAASLSSLFNRSSPPATTLSVEEHESLRLVTAAL